MNNIKLNLTLVMSVLIMTSSQAQEKPDNHLLKNITGTVIGLDAVGNTISVRSQDQQKMSFTVTDKAVISQEAHPIGLMDIGKADTVTIQYYVTSPLKYFVVSIIDNESVVNE